MGVQETARRLSWEMRELLILHVVGPQPVDHSTGSGFQNIRRSRNGLVDRSFIRFAPAHVTIITELGREAAAVVLGDCADMLVRAGALDEIKSLNLTPRALAEFRLLATSEPVLTDS